MASSKGANGVPMIGLGLTRHRPPHNSDFDNLRHGLKTQFENIVPFMHAWVDWCSGIAMAEDSVLKRVHVYCFLLFTRPLAAIASLFLQLSWLCIGLCVDVMGGVEE